MVGCILRKYKNYWFLSWALFIGVVFSFAIYFTLHQGEKTEQQLVFQAQAQSTVYAIKNELSDFTNALYSLGDFVTLSENITREQFGQFTQNHLSRYSSILSFSWNVFIESENRQAFSQQLTAEGYPNVDILKTDTNGLMIPDDQRGYYFPVYFIEPIDRLASLLGFNLASHDLRHKALKTAFNQEKLTATEKLTLVVLDEKITGILLLLPIFDKVASPESELPIKRGVLVEAVNLNSLLLHALAPVNTEKFDLIILDEDADLSNQVLFDSTNQLSLKEISSTLSQFDKETYWQQSITFANRNLSIIVLPKQDLLTFKLISYSWLGFISSLLLTFILGYYWLKRLYATIETVVNSRQHKIANKKFSEEIVERLKVEKELIKFAHAFQLSADGINLLNMNGEYTYCNQAALSLYGYNADEMYMLHYYDVNKDPAIKELDLLTQVRLQGAWHGEFEQTRKDGSHFSASISLSLIKDDSGSELGILEITRDITETNLLETELQQSKKMEALGTLAGGIAHDFNNILASILGNAEMAIMSKIEPIKTQSYIENIQESCNRAADLVKQIMTFSRMETMRFEEIDLAKAVNNALTIIRASLPANIHITSSIPQKCPPIKGDVTQIHQILMNLCSNASQAIGDIGGSIAIDLHQETTLSYDNKRIPKEQVKLSITDTGKGISSEDLSKIFDPFFTTKKVGEGTGLGLAVVKSIVEEHEGEINVKSVPNQGASFIISFPTCKISNVEQIEVEPVINIEKKASLATKHVLIAEDEPHIAKLYEEFINEFGYQTTICTDGKQALDAFNDPDNHFDLVLTDQAMPLVTGKELSILLLSKQPDLPIIMCTGYSEVISEELAKEIGIKQYILKPASLTKLMTAIDNLLKD